MPSVNIFVGGTGVKSAVLLRGRAQFYRYEQTMGRIIAIDTEPNQDGAARPTLGRDLIVADGSFAGHIQTAASAEATTKWTAMWFESQSGAGIPKYRESFGFTVIRAGAETVNSFLRAQSGLYTLRAAGWLALQDLLRTSPNLIQQIVGAIQTAADGAKSQTTILRVVASVAGGTGSGLFIPLITAIRDGVGQGTNYQVHLVLVTHSAFTNTFAKSQERDILRTRGMSGTYAAFREVQYLALRDKLDQYTPEARPLFGYAQVPGLDRVYWLGRRNMDSNSTEEDTFFEASRILALCNDDGFERLMEPQLGNFPHTQMPSLLTIEYPKYEIAQRLAAAAAVDLVDHMLKPRGDIGQPLLGLRTESRGPLLTFVYERRQSPLLLSSRAGAEQEPIEQDDISGPRGLLRHLNLPNSVVTVVKGSALHPPAYNAVKDADWKAYVGHLKANLAAKKRDDLSKSEDVLADVRRNAANFVVQVAADAYTESADPRTGIVSLAASRERLQELAEAFDLAQVFFKRGVVGAVAPSKNVDWRLRPSQEQEARASDAETRLLSRLTAQPPREWYFNQLITGLLFLIGTLALGALVVQAAFPGAFRSMSSSLLRNWTPEQQQLLTGAVLAYGLGIVHAVWRARSGKKLDQVRREAEDRLLKEYEWLVVCQQAEMVFEAGRAICVDAVGDSARRSDVRQPEGLMGQAFALGAQAVAWLTELREVGLGRGQRANRQSPQVFRRVAYAENVPSEQLRPFWPPVRAEAVVTTRGVNSLALLDLRIAPPDNVGVLNVRDYLAPSDPVRNSDDVGRRIDNLGVGFLTAIEHHIQERIADKNFLPETLDGMLSLDNQLNTPDRLAESLNELAREAQNRGAPGALVPAPAEARSFVVVPDAAVAAKVNAAIRLGLANDFQGRYSYLSAVVRDDGQGNFCQVHRNIGEAIALVQFRYFGWPDQDHPQFQDISDAAKVHYAVGARVRGGDPGLHGNYNVTNTEFYVLPELSAAARIESHAGLTRPLANRIVSRLYGSHLLVTDVPTPLEMFYLADHLGLFVNEDRDPGAPWAWAQPGLNGAPATNGASTHVRLEAPMRRWHLLIQPPGTQVESVAQSLADIAFPLVEHAFGGASQDPLHDARPRLILFDAFLVAMGYRGEALDSGHVPQFGSWGGQMLHATWSQPAVYARLRTTRENLLRYYFQLKSDPGPVYAAALQSAERDAASMSEDVGNDWRLICSVVLGEGLRRLQQTGSMSQTPSTTRRE